MYPVFDVRSTSEVRDNASFTGGLSAESVDIAAGNATNLIKSTNNSARDIGGLSAESVDIAAGNATNLIRCYTYTHR